MRNCLNRTRARARALAPAVCEALEERQLLVAFQLFVDNNPVPGPTTVNYGSVPLNSNGPSHTIKYRYLGTSTVSIDVSASNNDASYQLTSPDDSKTLTTSDRDFSVTYKLLTGRAVPRIVDVNLNYTEAGGDSDTRTFRLNGNVLPANVNPNDSFGALTNATRTPNGKIVAKFRQDGEGNTLEQVQPYLATFELPSAQNRLDVSFTGSSVQMTVEESTIFTTGKMSLLLAKDANGDGKLSIAEREEAAALRLTTDQINENSSASKSSSITRGAGKYLLFLSAADIRPASNDGVNKEMGFSLNLKVDDVAPPAFEVRGNNVVINNNDSTPSESDGTSFGNIGEGQQATLTFSVKNTGEATMNIDGQRPNVSGDFVIVEGLNSTVAAGGSDTFQVRLTNSTPGQKSGTITIQSSNASGGNFTFNIGGTVNGIVPPTPAFAVKSGTTLTVTGTNGNDTLTSTVGGGNFKFALNGEESASFAAADITKIVINLLDGNDNYSSATQLDIKQTINGGNGNDLIRGGKQADALFGNEGDDRMDGRTRGDLHDGGAGSDTAIYRQRRATEPVTVTIDETANDGGSSDQSKDNVLSSTEHVQGGLGNDNLTGSSKTNRLFGFEGNDTLTGLKGNDTLDGGAGENQINGGFGNDSIFSRNTIGDTIDGGADTDSLIGDLLDDIANVENPNLA